MDTIKKSFELTMIKSYGPDWKNRLAPPLLKIMEQSFFAGASCLFLHILNNLSKDHPDVGAEQYATWHQEILAFQRENLNTIQRDVGKN